MRDIFIPLGLLAAIVLIAYLKQRFFMSVVDEGKFKIEG